MLEPRVIESADAVINLAGASLARLPWTRRYRKEILDSRVHSTRTLVEVMNSVATPPVVFLNASAVGIYGDRPGERLTESSPRGPGFLGDVVEAWESTARLKPEQTRLVTFRSGLVFGRRRRAFSARHPHETRAGRTDRHRRRHLALDQPSR